MCFPDGQTTEGESFPLEQIETLDDLFLESLEAFCADDIPTGITPKANIPAIAPEANFTDLRSPVKPPQFLLNLVPQQLPTAAGPSNPIQLALLLQAQLAGAQGQAQPKPEPEPEDTPSDTATAPMPPKQGAACKGGKGGSAARTSQKRKASSRHTLTGSYADEDDCDVDSEWDISGVEEVKRQKRLIKNRMTAAASRQRKKEELQTLRDRVQELTRENSELRTRLAATETELNGLRTASMQKTASNPSIGNLNQSVAMSKNASDNAAVNTAWNLALYLQNLTQTQLATPENGPNFGKIAF